MRRTLIPLIAFSLFTGALAQTYPALPKIYYISYPSLDPVNPVTVAAQLRLPMNTTGKVPAVVIVHGSSGIDSRGAYYADALNKAGIATLEIDLWGARGLIGGAAGRPKGVPETLPDAYGALKYLAGRPEIDPARIGILGFSWGGVVAMLTATSANTTKYLGDSLKFAGHAPFYPVCWVYNKVPGYEFGALTGASVLIQAGELDTYDNPDTCPKLVANLPETARRFVSVKVYPGATHAFNRLEPAVTVNDPFSHLGKGGDVQFVPNPLAALRSRTETLNFFERIFGIPRK
ncbi:dienelactone hydrolase family protein (plasmid) [Deinococcus radiomollis]|uniref:dienelactone hydrolase family protein n=1 Tax=Deinococcus radiomollis TaxID=468916 RepID=UPI0038919F8C